jgi:hypothetical protein
MVRKELIEKMRGMLFPRAVVDLKDPNYIIRAHIIGSFAPPGPPIAADAKVACIGSCFADEISKSLSRQGVATVPLGLSERWNTPFTVRAFLEYGLLGKPFPEGFMLEGAAPNPTAFENLKSATAYIITLGLSVCWFDVRTNQMVVDIKNGHNFVGLSDAFDTHMMRQTSVPDNVQQIEQTIACIRAVNPTAPIVFTLSPVPILLSKTGDPPIVTNTVSKATLRVALDEIMRQRRSDIYYWPSYEIIEWKGKYLELLWGQEGNDLRHLPPAVIDDIMRRFIKLYLQKQEGEARAPLEVGDAEQFIHKSPGT